MIGFPKLKQKLDYIQRSVIYELDNYKKMLDIVNTYDFSDFTENQLAELWSKLKQQAAIFVSEGVTLDSDHKITVSNKDINIPDKNQLVSVKGIVKKLPDEIIAKTFALIREAAARVLGERPYDQQILAALALYDNKVVEMQTGEGKTLAAVLPACLKALTGISVHILTFNDYLARRDAEWMRPVYSLFGLKVSFIRGDTPYEERKAAYQSDILYITAKECGFDYLRDFVSIEKSQLLQRDFEYAIVDEADSILIDEARIPLVIAGERKSDSKLWNELASLAGTMINGIHYDTDNFENNVFLTEEGVYFAEKMLGHINLYSKNNNKLLAALNCALHAEVLLKKDRDYIIRNSKIEIIDNYTGRTSENRSWPESIQKAVEAKEGLESSIDSRILASITMQFFINLYPSLSGMTGTAATSSVEFYDHYGLETVIIPTHKKCIRKDQPDQVLETSEEKYRKVAEEVKKAYQNERPVLIGTASIYESERLSELLRKEGIDFNVLNAKNDDMEAVIIENAGSLKAVTVSTNMAGRGVDIKLKNSKEKGGLLVIGTNRHESRRIDNQLRGRTGRQGDPGESRFIISLEDEIFEKYYLKSLFGKQDRYNEKTIDYTSAIEKCQRIIEGHNSDERKELLRYSYIIEEQRKIIHKKQRQIIISEVSPGILSKSEITGELYKAFILQYGLEKAEDIERIIYLCCMRESWADYLHYIGGEKEGIHLVLIGGKNPFDEFNRHAIKSFEIMMKELDEEVEKVFVRVCENNAMSYAGLDLEKAGLLRLSGMRTYLVNESPGQFAKIPDLMKLAAKIGGKKTESVLSIFKRVFMIKNNKYS